MKLYDVKGGSMIKVVDNSATPPDCKNVKAETVLKFCHIDGMYSLCYDGDQPVHLAAWTEVEVVS